MQQGFVQPWPVFEIAIGITLFLNALPLMTY